jgi:hypothetical protein
VALGRIFMAIKLQQIKGEFKMFSLFISIAGTKYIKIEIKATGLHLCRI